MAAKKAEVRWSDVKQQLQGLGEAKLLGLLHDLFQLAPENRAFLAAGLLGASAARSLLGPYRERIERAFYKCSGLPQEKLQLADARQAIREYRAATSDLEGTLELMLTYLETGTQFTREFGDIDESFYNSLTSVLGEVERMLAGEGSRRLYELYRDRLVDLAARAQPIGWGYGDAVADTVTVLQRRYAGE